MMTCQHAFGSRAARLSLTMLQVRDYVFACRFSRFAAHSEGTAITCRLCSMVLRTRIGDAAGRQTLFPWRLVILPIYKVMNIRLQ